jgi:hypothetical protein
MIGLMGALRSPTQAAAVWKVMAGVKSIPVRWDAIEKPYRRHDRQR